MNKNEQELKKLKNKVKSSIHMFLANDNELLSLAGGVHEQTISHRIAVYLEPLFKDYHVDCEYNKHGDRGENKKIIENVTNSRQTCKCEKCKKWSRRRKNSFNSINKINFEIRPDIIIRKKRGEKSNGNILVIEIKKNKECLFDQEKLKALTLSSGDFKYRLGTFIYFSKCKPKYKWFVNGKENSD